MATLFATSSRVVIDEMGPSLTFSRNSTGPLLDDLPCAAAGPLPRRGVAGILLWIGLEANDLAVADMDDVPEHDLPVGAFG